MRLAEHVAVKDLAWSAPWRVEVQQDQLAGIGRLDAGRIDIRPPLHLIGGSRRANCSGTRQGKQSGQEGKSANGTHGDTTVE